jgi:tRNA (cmo5U34)-methyltransferase
MNPNEKDEIYSKKKGQISDFVFDTQVVSVFDDMIARSVPLYEEVQLTTAQMAAKMYQPGTAIIDLGCSTGASLIAIKKAISGDIQKLIGIDNSKPMLARCKEKLSKEGIFDSSIELIEDDITSCELKNASVVVLNYTLQFIAPEQRQEILRRIFDNLNPGGAIILTEKITHDNEKLRDTLYELHLGFKRAHGYSDLEIAQKREAIENVLVPLTSDQNITLLQNAGFQNVDLALQWFNFASFIAIKD